MGRTGKTACRPFSFIALFVPLGAVLSGFGRRNIHALAYFLKLGNLGAGSFQFGVSVSLCSLRSAYSCFHLEIGFVFSVFAWNSGLLRSIGSARRGGLPHTYPVCFVQHFSTFSVRHEWACTANNSRHSLSAFAVLSCAARRFSFPPGLNRLYR